MTLSILAKDVSTGAIGCAAATGNIGVGGWVLRAAVDGGAVATQGYSVSPIWGDEALQMLRQNRSIDDIVDTLIDPDAGKMHRQFAIIDLDGKCRAFTGKDNKDFKGSVSSEQAIFTGNWLAGRSVLDDMKSFYENNISMDFANRLLGCLKAAAAAGGDSRGLQSAALRIVHPEYAPIDLRVDFDGAPVERLAALYEMASASPYADWLDNIPTLKEPYKC